MSTPNFKPMLAYTISDVSKESYPAKLSIKLDGIRAVVLDGVVYSRSMKPIRSKTVQELFGKPEYNGLDGELLYGDWDAPDVFNTTTQVVMATELKPEFCRSSIAFVVFDYVLSDAMYDEREDLAYEIINKSHNPQLYALSSEVVSNEGELLDFEAEALRNGFEGIMKRGNTKYKQGRSTFKEQGIGKLKRFKDDEAVVVGYEELMTNTNAKVKNELGYSERSTAKDGLVPAGVLGALVCEHKGMRFNIGSGFSAAQRKQYWSEREMLVGRLVTFKHFECGQVDLPRFPIFKAFRDPEDMS